MSFNQAKDEFLKWIIPVLLVAIWSRGEKALDLIALQTNHAIKTDEKVSFLQYRADQHRDKIATIDRNVSDQSIKIGKLEIKVFGQTLSL